MGGAALRCRRLVDAGAADARFAAAASPMLRRGRGAHAMAMRACLALLRRCSARSLTGACPPTRPSPPAARQLNTRLSHKLRKHKQAADSLASQVAQLSTTAAGAASGTGAPTPASSSSSFGAALASSSSSAAAAVSIASSTDGDATLGGVAHSLQAMRAELAAARAEINGLRGAVGPGAAGAPGAGAAASGARAAEKVRWRGADVRAGARARGERVGG